MKDGVTNISRATQERSPEKPNGRSAQEQYLEAGTMKEAEGAGEAQL